MRSRLPGKLRSSPDLPGAMIVKNWTPFAKCRLVMGGSISQILHNADQAPRQQEAKAQKQEQRDRDIHGSHRNWIRRHYKMRAFSRL
jgi:hypothetical protein